MYQTALFIYIIFFKHQAKVHLYLSKSKANMIQLVIASLHLTISIITRNSFVIHSLSPLSASTYFVHMSQQLLMVPS